MSIIPESHSIMIDRYAEILVTHAVSLRPGQDVFIRGPEPLHEFGLRVGEAAYEHGARSVSYHFPNEDELYQLIASGSRHQISLYHDACREYLATVFKQNAALICLVHNLETPEKHRSLSSRYPDNHGYFFQRMSEVNETFGKYALRFPKTTAPVPTLKWASNVFPDEEMPLQLLWDAILRLADVEDEDYEQSLRDRRKLLRKRIDKLNSLSIRELRFHGHGVDLSLSIVNGARWTGSTLQTESSGQEYFHTFPSIDAYTVPNYKITQGVLSCYPLRLSNRSLVSGLSVEFRDGELVDFEASEGRDSFAEWIDADSGSRFLGEVGLVGNDSPFYGRGDFFDFPPINRNVSSYVSIGGSSPWARPAMEMTDRELSDTGCNKSTVHADLIVESADLSIVATNTNRDEVPILENGEWCGSLNFD